MRRCDAPKHGLSGPWALIRYATCLVGAFLAIFNFAACAKRPSGLPGPSASVTVSVPLARKVIDSDEFTGHLQAPETANIVARVSGFLVATPFSEGAVVNKDDLLFAIDDRPFKADLDSKQATVAKDQAQLALTKIQLDRQVELLKKKVIAPQDFDTAKVNYDQAQAQLASDQAAAEASRLNLEWTQVRAPIAGRTSRFDVTVGNFINGGAGQATLLTTIVSVDPVYCYITVPELSYLKYQRKGVDYKHTHIRDLKIPCFIELENETNFPHEGVIDFVDNSLDPNTGTIQARGVIPNPSGSLRPGLFARMRVTARKPYDALLVPDSALGTT